MTAVAEGAHVKETVAAAKVTCCSQRQIQVYTVHLYEDQCTLTCLSGWTGYNLTCFRFINEEMNWIEAEVYCQNLVSGGHLASIHSKKNNDFVLNLVQKEKSSYQKFWIGSSDKYRDGIQLWTDGSRWDYHNWLIGRPIAGLRCIAMNLLQDSGFWSDEECIIHKYPFICVSHTKYD
ncbi:lectin-like [Narcine bancroftii]|uniref:lectin-like n=1 Tax=Narcine bancroftii TaxID=1343680 RepID=UPI003830FF19